jgi:hypothetical protein
MTDVEAAMVLQRIRVRVADRYGLTVAEMRALVLGAERPVIDGRLVTEHGMRGGRDCPGC